MKERKTATRLILLLSVLLAFSCDDSLRSSDKVQLNSTEVENIDVPFPTTTDWSSIVKPVKDIQLETTEESLIGRIDKFQVFKDRIYVLDIRIAKSIFIFDLDGNYIDKIDKVGEGEGEFYLPFDFCINPFTERIEVMEVRNRKIISYDLDGAFREEWRIDGQLVDFIPLVDSKYAFHIDGRDWPPGEQIDLLHISDARHSKLIETGVSDYPSVDYVKARDNLTNTYGRVLYMQAMHDTIYQVVEESIQPVYFIDFGPQNAITPETKKLLPQQLRQKLMAEDYYLHRGNILESSQFIGFLWSKKEVGYLGKSSNNIQNDLLFTIYDKTTKIAHTVKAIDVIGESDFTYPSYAKENQFYSIVYPALSSKSLDNSVGEKNPKIVVSEISF